MDIFSIPEMTLLAVANDYFITNDIEYDPVHLFKDVSVSDSSQWQMLLLFSSLWAWAVSQGSIFFGLLFSVSWMLRNLLSWVKLDSLLFWAEQKTVVTDFFVSVRQEAIGMVHLKGYMYKWVMEDLGKKTHRSD